MPTLVPIRAVKDVLREVRDEAREQGRREGREEATRMLEWAVQLNGHGPAVLKSLREESDAGGSVADRVPGADPDRGMVGGVDERTGPQKEELTDDDVNDAVTLAAIDALIEAKTHGAESGPIYDYLVSLLGDSDALRAAADVIYKASGFDESKHPRGDDGRFIGRERIHAAKSDPALADKLREQTTDPEERKKLEAALAGEVDTGRTKAGLHRDRVAAAKKEKAERIARVRELADDMSMARRGGEPVPAEKYRELMEHLPALSIKELRSVREKLAASFWTRTRREDMVTALVRHARIRAEQAEYDAKHADDDPLDFGMLGEVESRPTDRRNEDLNPWHETDKLDAGAYGEAQHGGRMYQRHMLDAEHGVKDTVAYNERGADVKPEWRDDSGKPVDTITPALADQKEIPEKTSVSAADAPKASNKEISNDEGRVFGKVGGGEANRGHVAGVETEYRTRQPQPDGSSSEGVRGQLQGDERSVLNAPTKNELVAAVQKVRAMGGKWWVDGNPVGYTTKREAVVQSLNQLRANSSRAAGKDAGDWSHWDGDFRDIASDNELRAMFPPEEHDSVLRNHTTLSRTIDAVNKKNEPEGGWTDADRVPLEFQSPTTAPPPTTEHKAGDRVARRQRGGYPVGGQVVEVYKSQRDGTMLAKVKWDNGQTTSVKLNAIKPENKDEIAAARQAWKEKHGKA